MYAGTGISSTGISLQVQALTCMRGAPKQAPPIQTDPTHI